ncbi:MAG: Ig-like domain-containing protein, partial [Myxococcales bacterium]
SAIEATYATGVPKVGDEITFSRIRIVMNTNAAGTYTVSHPYGVEVFPGVQGGKRSVFFTVDIGVSPGVFTGALAGGVGPFLEWDQNVANPTSPFGIDPASGAAYSLAIVNPDGSAVQFVGDPNFTHTVTGSPFLQNFLRVQGPVGSNLDGAGNDFIETNLFTVLGQLYTVPIPTQLVVYRTGVSVDTRGYTMVDVFADAVPGATLIATADNVPTKKLFVDPASGEAFSHVEFFPVLPPGPSVTVTNVSDVPPSSKTVPLTDVVDTSQAVLFPDPSGATTGALSIIAQTSVQLNPPALAIVELPGALKTVDPLTPWIQRFDATIPAGVTPPWHLTAISTMGGTKAEPVIFGAMNVPATPGPLALPLAVTTAENTPLPITVVDVATPAAIVMLLNPPASGTVAVSGPNLLTYTPKNLFFGADSFTYLLFVPDPLNLGSFLYSNLGTVAVTVTAVNNPPVAVADSGSTTGGTPVIINVAANDTDVDGTVVPASVLVTTAPPAGAGTIVNNLNGTVTFTPAAAFSGSFTFQYTIADNFGARSAPGTVTVLVTALAERLTISRAEFTVKSGRYRALGTSTVFGVGVSNTVTIRAGTHAVPGVLIGSAPIDALGNWIVDIVDPALVIPCNTVTRTCPATISSTGGGWTDFSYAMK